MGVVGVPVVAILVWLAWRVTDSVYPEKGSWLGPVVAAAVLGAFAVPAFLFMSDRRSADVVFDRRAGTASGTVWTDRGWRHGVTVGLSDIVSLQVCTRRVERGAETNIYDYDGYELNVVLSDGRRLGLGSHGEPGALAADSERLAAFLGCAVLNNADLTRRFGPAAVPGGATAGDGSALSDSRPA